MPGKGADAVSPERHAVELAVAALRDGLPVVLPTDTVYGVAVLASVTAAAQRLSALKARAATQPFAVLVADVDQARLLSERFPTAVERLVTNFWPGPVTFVVRRRAELRGLELGGDRATIGVRCPDHTLVRELTHRLGPLITTSANRHGEPTPTTAQAAAASLAGPVAVVLDGGVLAGPPSAVVDCTVEPPKLLRGGSMSDQLRDWATEHGG